MVKFLTPFFALAVLLLSACTTSVIEDEERQLPEPTPEESTVFNRSEVKVDESQSYISFIGKSNLINHEGAFRKYDVTITPGDGDFTTAQIDATIEIASVETDSEAVSNHLLKDDFFAAEDYPQATFTSTEIVNTGGDTYEVTGDLTIRDTTLPITLTGTVTNSYLLLTGEIAKNDYGVTYPGGGEKILEPMVPIEIKMIFESETEIE